MDCLALNFLQGYNGGKPAPKGGPDRAVDADAGVASFLSWQML